MITEITAYDKLCYIEADDDVLKQIDNILSFMVQGAFFSKQYRARRWDGKTHLFNKKSKSFNRGLLYRVLTYLDNEEIEYVLFDKSTVTPNYQTEYIDQTINGFTLRPYQKKAILKYIKSYWGLTNSRGIFDLPPRSGKTLLSGFLSLVLNEYPILFVVHKIDLAYQTKGVFDELFGIDCGIVGDGNFKINSKIVISTIQSIATTYQIKLQNSDDISYDKEKEVPDKQKFKQFISSVKVVIGDECHISAANVHQSLIPDLKSVKYMVGLSGTPFREDKSSLLIENMYGPIIFQLSREEAVRNGYVLPIKSYFIELPEIAVSAVDTQTMKKEAVNQNPYMIESIVKLVKRCERKGLSSIVMIREHSQGNLIQEQMKSVIYLKGSVSGEQRKAAYKMLERKQILTILSTVTDIGVDIPTLDCVIVAGITKSKTLALQRIRCGTPGGNKKFGRIFIFCPKISNKISSNKKYVENWWKKTLSYYKNESTFTVKHLSVYDL